MSPYLSHGGSPLLSEGVVVEVEDAEVWVVLHCRGQGCHTGMIDAILGHMNLLQAAHQLGTQIIVVRYKLLYIYSHTAPLHRGQQQFICNNRF